MRFIDFFAGIGGFRRGMELAGHECVGFCEFDKYAVMSYTVMHLATEEQREYLASIPLKERQKEVLRDEYRNGEWFSGDVRTVDARSLPAADCWCFGFPCQDISVAGKQTGFYGNRSSLFFRVMYLAGQLEEAKKPSYLFIENVKNLLSVNGGWDFARLLAEMDRGGYDAEWGVLNSKYFGVPQNRERCFIIGHLRTTGTGDVLPVRDGSEGDSSEIQRRIRGRGKNCSGALCTCENQYDRKQLDRLVYDYDNETVRQLTPKECFRLQGWTDEYFNRAALVNSDSQLYKQAGNGVTVNVIYEMAKKMK